MKRPSGNGRYRLASISALLIKLSNTILEAVLDPPRLALPLDGVKVSAGFTSPRCCLMPSTSGRFSTCCRWH